jgi:hypothetical protein
MKTILFQLTLTVAVTFGVVVSVSYADYTDWNSSLETLQINDATSDSNTWAPNPLYRIFNEYFSDELSTLYTSGNQLADERMIRQTISSWQVNSGSEVLASFTSSALQHSLLVYDTIGQLVFDTGLYGSSTDGNPMIDGQNIILDEGNYVFAATSTKYSEGLAKSFSGDHDWYFLSEEYLQNSDLNPWESYARYYEDDSVIHLIAFEVTDLIRQREGYEDIESAYLFAFEDLYSFGSDFDYQDFAFVLTNVKANTNVTPEPATVMILGIAGGIALPYLRRRMKNKK